MLKALHQNRPLQLTLGLLIGICFGFLLQKGGVTRYEAIMGQLLLYDWTVFKVIFTAIAIGMPGVYLLRRMGLAQEHRKPGSVGRTVVGGLIFGLGFGLLGYCPGTAMGAVGQGSMDALLGGVLGMIVGSAVYAVIYPRLKGGVLNAGDFGDRTIPEWLGIRSMWKTIGVAVALIALILLIIEAFGG